MDYLNNIRVITFPKWLRFKIGILLLLAISLNLYIFWQGLISQEKDTLVSASTELLAVLLPIIILALMFGFSNNGIASLNNRTDKMLNEFIPKKLILIPDYSNYLSNPEKNFKKQATITNNHTKGLCYCDYLISFPSPGDLKNQSSIIIRAEINIRKVNINIFISSKKIEEHILNEKFSSENDTHHKLVYDYFFHTTTGAENNTEDPSNEREISYIFNKKLLDRSVDNKKYHCLVAKTTLNPDFLWDPSEILFFTQDLMFMIRSFYTEHPEIFDNDIL